MAQDLSKHCSHLLNIDAQQLLTGETVNLYDACAGKVVLFENTASKCAFTPRYEQLGNLYDIHKNRGVVVLGFPSNDFGHQEPGSEKQIQDFCRLTYNVQLLMLAKTL